MYDLNDMVAVFCCGFLLANMIEMIMLCREIRKAGGAE
jgi:hypothetical protein